MTRAQDGLRSTPRRLGHRDHEVFPEAEASYRATRWAPHLFHMRVTPTRVSIIFDYLFIPTDMAARIRALYAEYIAQWVAERTHFPRRGIGWGDFQDGVMVTVRREHAPWWIALFREMATVCYNPYAPEPRPLASPEAPTT